MKTAMPPLPVVRTQGSRIQLADGRELIDGVASWWTACHGYNQPHIRQAVERQLSALPHVMFGGLAHQPAITLARRLAALLPGDLDRVFFSDSGSSRSKSHEDGGAILDQSRRARPHQFVAFKGGYHGDTTGAMAVSDTEDGMHALFAACCRNTISSICRTARSARPRSTKFWLTRGEHRRYHRRATGAGRRRHEVPRHSRAQAPARGGGQI